MIIWAQEYWYLCAAALVIGIVTAAWIWLGARRRSDGDDSTDLDSPPRRVSATTAAPPQPLAPIRPVIDIAERVDFTPPPPAEALAEIPVTAATGAEAPHPAIMAAVGEPDDLLRIKGVGPKLGALLTSLGITRYDQIAAWTDADLAEVDRFLGAFRGRPARDRWIEQARLLASGDTAGFSATFGAV